MNAPAQEGARLALMLHELRLPTIGRLWPEFAQRSDKESWQATRFLAALLEHEVAERGKLSVSTIFDGLMITLFDGHGESV